MMNELYAVIIIDSATDANSVQSHAELRGLEVTSRTEIWHLSESQAARTFELHGDLVRIEAETETEISGDRSGGRLALVLNANAVTADRSYRLKA